MTEDNSSEIDKLSEVLKSMQTLVKCMICLETISVPVKTRCGHSFCRACITRVLNEKNASCPLCNASLKRRSISDDEHVKTCIDRLYKLVTAIQIDTGIDILSHVKNPQSTRESATPYTTHVVKSRVSNKQVPTQENLWQRFVTRKSEEPSEQPCHVLSIETPSTLKVISQTKRHETKSNMSEDSLATIKLKANTRYGLSGIPSNDKEGKNTITMSKDKVQSWLRTLENDQPVCNNPETSGGDRSNDAVINSVCRDNPTASLGETANLVSTVNSDKAKRLESSNEERRMQNPTRRRSLECRNEENQKGKSRRSLDSRNLHSMRVDKTDDRWNDANKSTGTKETWSRVEKFGKEMRTRRRKVRSLNVSIESTNKQKKSDDVSERGSVKSWLIAGTLHKDKKGNKVGTSEEPIKNVVDRQECEKEPAETGTTPLKETRDKVVPLESSFITLARGEQVRIKNLNSDQMNDIIGVGDEDCRNAEDGEDDPSTARICKKSTLSLRRYSESGNSPEKMRRNEGTLLWKSPPFPLSVKEHSPPETRRIQKISEIFSSPTFRTPLPSETSVHRLSLRKNQGSGSGSKSEASPMLQDTSRLSSVKRDLSEEMFQSKRDTIEEDRMKSRVNEMRREKCNARENTIANRNDLSQRTIKRSSHEGTSVRFVKLSKIHKQRRNAVKFLYLGTMSRRESRNIEINTQLRDSGEFERVETVDRAVEALPMNECINRSVQTTPLYADQNSSTIDYHFPNKQTHESVDVIFVSLNDNTQKEGAAESNTKDQRNEPDKKATNTVGRSPPVKDSQKFYSTQALDHERFPAVERTKRLETEENDKRNNSQNGKGNSFSELKGVHSRALIHTPWKMGKSDGFNVSIASRSNPKEKKQSSTPEKEIRYEDKRNQMDNDFSEGAESEHSFSSKNTLKVHNDNGKKTFLGPSSKFEESKMHCLGRSSDDLDSQFVKNVSLSSDTDTMHRKEIKTIQEKTKRKYKRIVSASSSDTDSNEIVCASKKRKNQFNGDNATTKDALNDSTKAADPQISKRKRTSSEESDSAHLNAILEDWGVNLNVSQRKRSKLGDRVWTKLERTAITTLKSDKSYLKNKTELAASRDLSTVESDMFESCDVPRTRKESTTEQIKIGQTENEFNDMIDKVRRHIRTERSPVDDDASDRGFKDQDIMQDNFDDVIANVDTQALIGLPQSEDIVLCLNTDDQQHRKAVRRSSNGLNSIKHISSSSDKENDVRRERSEEIQPNVDRSSNDRTLVPEDFAIVNEGDRDPLKKTISRNGRLRGMEGLSERVSDDRKADSRRSAPIIPDDKCSASKANNNSTEMKDSSHDQDSLMNVTQYQLMLKQFEEDLFGSRRNRDLAKPSSVDALKEKRTAGKGEIDVNRENTDTCTKDAEQSGGEDDIVESTPDTKMKNGQAFNVTSRRNVRSITPVSRRSEAVSTTTPSPLTEYSSNSTVATPFSKGRMLPLYQSTPKSTEINATENRIGNPTCTAKEKLECVSNTNVSLAKQVKDNAVGSACRPASPKLCFVCSGLDSGQTEQVKELAQTFNGEFTKQFTPKVTHVIIKTGENNAAAKTLKYLQGVAYRKWIVGFKWVADCLKEKKFLDEDPYEAVDGVTLEAGPRNSRLRQKGLFEEFTFLCIGPYDAVSVKEYEDLLLANGAMVVHSLETLIAVRDKLKIIMIQADIHDDHIIDWYRQASAVPIAHDWAVECISQYRLISFYPFLQELVPQDVLALGFPEQLVEEEDISDSDVST